MQPLKRGLQSIHSERLAQPFAACWQLRRPGPATDHQQGCARSLQRVQQIQARQAGQAVVAHQHVEGAFQITVSRGFGAAHAGRPVAQQIQHFRNHFARGGIVFDQKNAQGPWDFGRVEKSR